MALPGFRCAYPVNKRQSLCTHRQSAVAFFQWALLADPPPFLLPNRCIGTGPTASIDSPESSPTYRQRNLPWLSVCHNGVIIVLAHYTLSHLQFNN